MIEFLREQGAKGGRIGGRRTAERMTPAQRVARAKKASAAAAAARKRSAKKGQVIVLKHGYTDARSPAH